MKLPISKPSRLLTSKSICALGIAALLGQGMVSLAGPVSWGPAVTASADSDVYNLGNTAYAYWLAGIGTNSTITLNGVTFTPRLTVPSTATGVNLGNNYGANLPQIMWTNMNHTFPSFTANPTSYASGSFTNLSPTYQTLLKNGDYGVATSANLVTFTLQQLTPGHVYAIQIWSNDPRSGHINLYESLTSAGGNTVYYVESAAIGFPGQFSIGSFTATATNQVFTLQGKSPTASFNTVQFNGVQVRDVSGFNTWGGFVNNSVDFTSQNWSGNNTLAYVTNAFNNLAFYDTNNSGGAILNSSLSVQSAGISNLSLTFSNNAVAYSLQNVGGNIGISGAAAVTLAGSGSVTFKSPNTYTGATTVSGGSLALSGTGSIGTGPIVMNSGSLNTAGVTSFTIAGSQPITFGGGYMTAGALTLDGALLTNVNVTASTPLIAAGALTYGANASSITFPTTGNMHGFASYPTQFPLVTYTSIAGGAFNFNTVNLPVGYAGYISNNVANKSIDLVLTAGLPVLVPLTWSGVNGANWDYVSTPNWLNSTNAAALVQYQNFTAITFNDTASDTNVNMVVGTELPTSVTANLTNIGITISGGGTMGGTMALTKNGPGMLTLINSNNYTGGTFLNGGVVAFQSNGVSASGTITFNGGSLRWLDGNTRDISGIFAPPAGGQAMMIDIPDTNLVTFSSAISGAGGLNKLGSGTLVLNVADTFNGGATVSAGTLRLNSALGAGPGAIADASVLSLNIAGTASLTNAVTGAGVINIIEGVSANTTLGGPMSGFTGTINCGASPGGTAKAIITSTNVSLPAAATINIANGGTLYLAGVTLAAQVGVSGFGNSEGFGALRVGAGATVAGPIILQGYAAIGEFNTEAGAISGPMSDGGHGYGIVKTGSSGGSLALTGTNTYTGQTIISNGTLLLGASGSISNSAEILIETNAIFDVTGLASGFSLANNQILSAVGPSSAINGSVQAASGSLYLYYSNGIPAVAISAGTLTLNNNPVTVAVIGTPLTAGSYQLTTGGNVAGSVTTSPLTVIAGGIASANLQIINGDLYLVVTSVTAPLTWEGSASGVWDFTTANWTLTGSPATTEDYGDNSSVTFDDTATGTTSVSLAGTLTPASVTVSTTNDSYTFNGPGQWTGGMALTVNGNNTLTINNNNSFYGGVELNGGLLAFGPGGLGSNGPVNFNGGTLAWLDGTSVDLSARIQPIAFGVTANIVVSDANAVTFATGLSGSGGLAKTGSGYLALGGAGSYGNGTAINTGVLQLNSATAAGTGPINDLTTLNLNIAVGTLNNTISGPGIINVIETASSVSVLAGDMSSFTGTFNCPTGAGTSAKVQLSNTSLGASTVNVASGGTLWVTGTSVSSSVNVSGAGNSDNIGALRVDGNSSLTGPIALLGNTTIGNASTAAIPTISGNITDGGSGYSLTKVGVGALTLSGNNSYSGSTFITAGSFILGGGSMANTTNIVISGNATFNTGGTGFALGANQTLTSVATGTASSLLNGGANLSSGALTLNYTAGTASLVNTNGTLNLNNIPVTVNVLGAPLPSGTYVLISAAAGVSPGTMSGSVSSSTLTLAGFNLAANNSAGLQIVNNQLILNVQSTALPLTWEGNLSGAWDILTTKNWASAGTAEYFANNSPVTFDDTATGTTNVSMSSAVLPASVQVSTTNKNYTIGGVGLLSGGAALGKSGPGVLTLATSNSYSGGTVINDRGGIVKLSNPFALGTAPVTFAKQASDTGTLLYAATGINVISKNTYHGFNTALTGDTTVADIENSIGTNSLTGAMTITGAGAAGTGLSLKSDLPLSLNIAGPITTTTTGTPSVELNGSGGGLITGVISDGSGQLSLVKDGAGTWALQFGNTYTGGTVINNGSLSLSGLVANQLGTGSVTVNTNGTLYLGIERATFANTITGAGTVVVTVAPPYNTFIAGDMSGFTGSLDLPPGPGYLIEITSFAVNMNNAATVNISNNTTLYLGGFTMSAQINVAGMGSGTTYPAAIWANNTTFAGPVTLQATTAIGVGAAAGESATYSAPIGDGGSGYSLIINGYPGATTYFSASNTYGGMTIVSNGTLSIQPGGALSNSTGIALASGTTFDVSSLASFALGANQTLSGLGGGSVPAELNVGNMDMTLGALAIASSNQAPALDIEGGGTLTLNNNPVTVLVQDAPLGAGTYPLISASGGSVVGSVSSSKVTVTGSGLAAGMAAGVQISNGALNLVVQQANYIPPTLSGITRIGAGSFKLTFTGPSGQPYTVLTTTNLTTPLANWIQLTTGAFNGSPTNYTDTAATNTARFYVIESP